jgi:UDP-N-acetylmuramoyl-L-alanyl-D-glutamate--2,6-diaminopimelate ligase
VHIVADHIVLTDDNPRTEPPGAILDGIAAGIRAGVRYQVDSDRARAIENAISAASGQDVVVVAGKGHEDYQIYGHERRAFSDQQVVRAALAKRGGAG